MKILLLEKVDPLGDLGDEVQVKSGYARNYLVPYGKACYATPENLKLVEELREKLRHAEQQQIERARQRREKLQGAVLTVSARVSGGDRLFGSVTQADLADAIKAACGVEVEKKEIMNAPEGPIRKLGEYRLPIRLHPEVQAEVTVKVVPVIG